MRCGKWRYRLLVWIPLLFATPLFSQSSEISSISFEGLKKTRESFVRRYLTVQVGDQVDTALLEANRQRLVNLEMFSDVKYTISESAEGAGGGE